MALKSLAVSLLAVANLVDGHYTFARLRLNGEWQKPYQFIRNKTDYYRGDGSEPGNSLPYRGFHWPTFVSDSPNSVRCGRDNMNWAAQTEVLTVQAGSEFEIVIDAGDPWVKENWHDCPEDRGSCLKSSNWIWRFIHPGPVIVNLSPVPKGQDIRGYDGSGEWVKIFTGGTDWNPNSSVGWPVHWFAFNDEKAPPRITFKIPPQTPAGDYLMRMDQVWPARKILDTGRRTAQMYPSCAQLRVKSNSKSKLPAGILIPRDLGADSTGMQLSNNMTNFEQMDKDYYYPGGPLWDGVKSINDKPTCPESDPFECQYRG